MKSIASSKLKVKNELRKIMFTIIDTREIYVYSAPNVFYTASYHGVSYHVPRQITRYIITRVIPR